MPTPERTIYGLVGYPLGHSFSKSFFNQKFADEGINAEYLNFPIEDIRSFPELIQRNPQLKGLNVTIPYKQQVMLFLDDIEAEADHIGAVNVIKFEKNGRLVGYNSDIIGFVDSLRPLLKPWHIQALVLGTGGASKAVVAGLDKLGIKSQYVSRTPGIDMLSYDQITPEIMAQNKLIINTTPLGMYPNVDTCPPIPYSCITPQHLCYDLVYNPDETLFMRMSAEHGAQVKNGMEMLRLQALAAWDIWNR